MKYILFALLLVLRGYSSQGQYMQVTHFTGVAMYGTRAITVTNTGGTGTILASCLGPPLQYWTGASMSPGMYTYSSSAPIYSIYLESEGMNFGEYLEMYINGAPYTLTAANMISYSNCPGAGSAPSFLSGGKLYGTSSPFSWSFYNAGILQITLCSGINSFGVFCNGSGNGVAYHISIDTSAPPICSLIASNNGPVCEGDTLRLFATGDPSVPYNWFGPGGFSSTAQNPVIPHASWGDTGTYFVVQIVAGIPDTAWTHVTVKPVPVITATASTPICEGSDLLLYANPYMAGVVYSWSGPAAYTATLQNPIRTGVIPAHSGMYTVIANLNGCKDTSSIAVVVKPAPAIAASGNGPLCVGRDFLLSATPFTAGDTYTWTGPHGFSSTLTNPTVDSVSFIDSGLYIVVTERDGCSDTGSVYLEVTGKPEITASANTPVCEGDTIRLSFSPYTGTEAMSWSGPGSFSATVHQPIVAGCELSDSGVYTIIADLNGCKDTAAIKIKVNPIPEVLGTFSNNCVGDALKLFAASTPAATSYVWRGPVGYSSTLQNPVLPAVAAAAAGVYTVTAYANGCMATDTLRISLTDIRQYTKDTTVCIETPFDMTLSAKVPAGASATWTTGQTGSQITVKDTGNYYVTVTFNNCINIGQTTIRAAACECAASLPNAFTPNTDGKNDFFRPIILPGCDPTDYTFAIYNRWGELIFYSNQYTEKWNGTYRDVPCDMGVYMFYLTYTAGMYKRQYFYKGDVTLIR